MQETTMTAAQVLAGYDAGIAEAEARVEQLKSEREALAVVLGNRELLALVAKYGGYTEDQPRFVRVTEDGAPDRPSHKDLAWQVIDARRMVGFQTKTITMLVNQAGHDLTNVQVSNALSALKREGKIVSQPEIGKGRWKVVEAGPGDEGVAIEFPDTNGTAVAVPFDHASSPLAPESKAG